ncbi:unnamed protein product, partial [Rotaria magnacalcarata]
MDTSDSINLTPAQLEVGLINVTIDQSALFCCFLTALLENRSNEAVINSSTVAKIL